MNDGLSPGDRIEDRYVLRELLGEGGFACVYEAWDEAVGRAVAIKCMDVQNMGLTPDVQEVFLERFKREAQTAANLSHPNILEIHDIGQIDADPTRPFIVMEKLEGFDLDTQIEDLGKMSPERLFPLMVSALDALGKAHEAGIVHKDLKPANLFLCRPGTRTEQIKIVDFGIAYLHTPLASSDPEVARLTQTGQLLGTPQYLAPEYINAQQVTPALDVYQMGLIIIELLLGGYVMEGKTSLQCLVAHANGDLHLPKEIMEGALGDFLTRCLSRDPAHRFQDADEMAEALEAIDPASVDVAHLSLGTQRPGGDDTIAVADITSTVAMESVATAALDSGGDTIAMKQPGSPGVFDRVALVIGVSLTILTVVAICMSVLFLAARFLFGFDIGIGASPEPARVAPPDPPSVSIEVDPETAREWEEKAKKHDKKKKKKKKKHDEDDDD